MKRVVVTNTGKVIRERLGSRFLPKESKKMTVNNRQYLTLKAVRDFDVTIDNDINNDNSIQHEEHSEPQTDELDYYDLTVKEVLKTVREGIYDVDEAIAYEIAGKNRVTLLDSLEELKADD